MYSERFSLPFLASLLIAAAERRRPGLGPWTPQVRAELESVFRAELVEVKARFFELFDDKPYWEKLERNLMEVCFARYCTEAERQTRLEQNDYGIWRGGDLIARGVYAIVGLVVGIILVKVPWIPIPETWDLLIVALMILSPFLPDAQVWLAQRRFQKRVAAIVDDMAQAEAQQKLYQPLVPEAHRASELPPLEQLSQDAVPSPTPGERTGNKG